MGVFGILQKQVASPCQDQGLLSLKKSGVFFLMSLDLTEEKFQIPCHGLQGPAWSEPCFPLYLQDPLDPPSLTDLHSPSHPLPILNPAKCLAALRFCTAVLISKVPPELDSSLGQKPRKFSHFHQLLQNSQGVYIILFIFTTVTCVLSSASFSRRSKHKFSISAGFPNTAGHSMNNPGALLTPLHPSSLQPTNGQVLPSLPPELFSNPTSPLS